MTQPPDDAALVAEETRLLHMGPMPGGGFGMELEGGPIAAIGEYLANMLGMQTDTPANYVQMDIHRADMGWMTLTLQRQSGKTPHQLRAEAETKLAEAATALEAKDRRIARLEQVLSNVKLGNLPVMPTDEQRATARASDLYKRGDMRLMWVSESDLCMVEMAPMFAALEPSDKGEGR